MADHTTVDTVAHPAAPPAPASPADAAGPTYDIETLLSFRSFNTARPAALPPPSALEAIGIRVAAEHEDTPAIKVSTGGERRKGSPPTSAAPGMPVAMPYGGGVPGLGLTTDALTAQYLSLLATGAYTHSAHVALAGLSPVQQRFVQTLAAGLDAQRAAFQHAFATAQAAQAEAAGAQRQEAVAALGRAAHVRNRSREVDLAGLAAQASDSQPTAERRLRADAPVFVPRAVGV